MKSWIFTFTGVPVGYENLKSGRHVWDRYQEERVRRTIEFERQHDEKPIITKPIHIDYLFVFPSDSLAAKYHKDMPTAAALVNYINYIAHDAQVYDHKAVVSSTVNKRHEEIPYSQITIRLISKKGDLHEKKVE